MSSIRKQYPKIESHARAEGTEIHWGDEMALVNTDVRGRCYAPAGKTPVAYVVGGTQQKLSAINDCYRQKPGQNASPGWLNSLTSPPHPARRGNYNY